MLIYLIGCLLGFGLTHTFIIPHKTNEVPNLNVYLYGTFCSWLTVILFLFGVIVGFIKEIRKDGN